MTGLQLVVTEDGSHTLFNQDIQESYHSTHGALHESTHVFIGNGLRYTLDLYQKTSLTVFELGFGTGLNAVLTAIYAEQNQVNIIYESVEKFPLSQELALSLNYPELIEDTNAHLIFSKLHKSPWNQSQQISPYFGLKKIACGIEEYQAQQPCFDLCYFDAFAPSKQAEMWEIPILSKVYQLLTEGGILVTYSAKGQLKRDLKSLGFTVETLPGPPGKKEMVRAKKTG